MVHPNSKKIQKPKNFSDLVKQRSQKISEIVDSVTFLFFFPLFLTNLPNRETILSKNSKDVATRMSLKIKDSIKRDKWSKNSLEISRKEIRRSLLSSMSILMKNKKSNSPIKVPLFSLNRNAKRLFQ